MADLSRSTTLSELTEELVAFRDRRDWARLHRPKDLAIALSVEAGELLEHFLWRADDEVDDHLATNGADVAGELADVAAYLLYLAEVLGIDLAAALRSKVAENERRYPPSA